MRHSASTSPQTLLIFIKAKLPLPGGKVLVLSHMSLHMPNPSQPAWLISSVETSEFSGSLEWSSFRSRAMNLNTIAVTLKRRLEEL